LAKDQRFKREKAAEAKNEQLARLKQLNNSEMKVPPKASVDTLLGRANRELSHFITVYPPIRPIEGIRSIKSKDLGRVRLIVATHLYGKYKTPVCLQNAFLESKKEQTYSSRITLAENHATEYVSSKTNSLTELKREWFICVARGGSLYKEQTKGYLSKQETHSFLNSNIDSFQEALVYAVAIQFKNSKIAARLSHTKLSRIDESIKWLKEVKYREMIDFFCRHPDLELTEINDLIDYLEFAYGQRNAEGKTCYSLYGRTFESVKRASIEWHRTVSKFKIGYEEWDGFDMENRIYTDVDGIEWSMTQLLNTKDLTEEGIRQRHCVAGYYGRCKNGNVSIWSLRNQNKRALTVELTERKTVVQARGTANRDARPEELRILKFWAQEQQISVNLGRYM
jgi:hypothetical protein